MANIVEKKTFVCSDLEKNSNKFWKIIRFSDNSVKTEWGRVGNSHDELTKSFSSTKEAEKFFSGKVRDKLRVKEGRRDAYTEIEVLEDKITTTSPVNRDLANLAANEIETSSQTVKEFIKWLAKINIHNITSSTTIKYNIVDGTFTTPLGVIGSVTLNEAKILLDQISKFTDINDKECIKTINQYVRRIPQDMGGSHVKIHAKNVFGTNELLQHQLDIIEGLETAISQAKPVNNTESERLFNTKLDICQDVKVIEGVREKFSRYDNGNSISNVYEINIKDTFDRFVSIGKPVGNIDRLWHATNPRNILSICKFGLVIPKTYSNGWNHGSGIYFSDRSSKSRQYMSREYKDGKSVGYMFIADVAMGTVLYDTGSNSLSKTHNCRWAHKSNRDRKSVV